MPNLILNDETIALSEQEPATFKKFAEMAFPQCVSMLKLPRERRFIAMLPAAYVVQARREETEWSDPLLQAAMWNLHDLGVEQLSFGAEAAAVTPAAERPDGNADDFIRFDKAEATDMAHGRASAINFSTVSSGRGYIAALNNVIHRVFQLNGENLEVGIQARPELEKTAKLIAAARQNEEGLLFATSRTLGAMLRQGRGPEDIEIRTAIELLSNMGCSGVAVDMAAGRMVFTGFSLMNALASAFLQGLTWDQMKNVRTNVELLQKQLEKEEGIPVQPAPLSPIGSRRRRR